MYEFPTSSRVQHPSGTGVQGLLADPVTTQCRYTTQCASGAHPAPYSWGCSGRGVKLTTRLPCSTKVKNEWIYTSAPPIHFDDVDRDCIIK